MPLHEIDAIFDFDDRYFTTAHDMYAHIENAVRETHWQDTYGAGPLVDTFLEVITPRRCDVFTSTYPTGHPNPDDASDNLDDRLIFLAEERCLGITVSVVELQDIVNLFDAADTPFTLRPVADTDNLQWWQLFCDSYLHGWMNGGYFGCDVVGTAPKETNPRRRKCSTVKASS